jgi:hypothetical protein
VRRENAVWDESTARKKKAEAQSPHPSKIEGLRHPQILKAIHLEASETVCAHRGKSEK